MQKVSVVARYLLGIIFLIFGANGFLHFIPMPPPTGAAAQFFGALFASGYLVVIFGLQLVGAILLLSNRFVPLALTLLGPVIVNIFFVHLLMAPEGLVLALTVTILWFLSFWGVRSHFAGLFASRAEQQG
jgi:putative oxidoreductase